MDVFLFQYSIPNRFLKTSRQKKRKKTVRAFGPPWDFTYRSRRTKDTAFFLFPFRIPRVFSVRGIGCGFRLTIGRMALLDSDGFLRIFDRLTNVDSSRFFFPARRAFSLISPSKIGIVYLHQPFFRPRCHSPVATEHFLHTDIILKGWQPCPAVIPMPNT